MKMLAIGIFRGPPLNLGWPGPDSSEILSQGVGVGAGQPQRTRWGPRMAPGGMELCFEWLCTVFECLYKVFRDRRPPATLRGSLLGPRTVLRSTFPSLGEPKMAVGHKLTRRGPLLHSGGVEWCFE